MQTVNHDAKLARVNLCHSPAAITEKKKEGKEEKVLEGELQKLQQLNLMILDEVDRICQKHEIPYSIVFGTMLGAIRHKGIIPWDDDIDIGLTRENFEKLLAVCEKELDPSQYYLQTEEKDEKYVSYFAKVQLVGTTVIQEDSYNVEMKKGIFIDIFPYDHLCENKILRKIRYRKYWIWRALLRIRCGYGKEEKKTSGLYRIGKFFSGFFSISFMKKMKKKETIKYNRNKTRFVGVISTPSKHIDKRAIPLEWFEDLVDYPFEGRTYTGFANYDEYLKKIYGDYMTLPPMEERNHHRRMKVDFGAY